MGKPKKNVTWIEDMSCEKTDFREPHHPPFSGDRKAEVQRQHEILKDVYISDYDNYELGFRGDVHPDYEIGTWKQIADGFAHLAAGASDLAKRKAIFACIFLTRMAGRATIDRQPLPQSLSRRERRRIINHMYDTYGDPRPARFFIGSRWTVPPLGEFNMESTEPTILSHQPASTENVH